MKKKGKGRPIGQAHFGWAFAGKKFLIFQATFNFTN